MKYFQIAAVGICLVSCSTYQYATVSSPLKNETTRTFEIENDTVRVVYDFNGLKGPVKISVYNKLSIPLYVDWNKSALIKGDGRLSYGNKNSALNAELRGTETRWVNSSSQNATIEGTITSGNVSSFIPPNAGARECQVTLDPGFFMLPLPDHKNRKRVNNINVRSFSYSKEASPFSFRSFLTISTHADLSSPTHFDHSFWVSEIFQTIAAPRNFTTRPDQFYVKKTNNAAVFVLIAGTAGATVLVMQESKEAFLD